MNEIATEEARGASNRSTVREHAERSTPEKRDEVLSLGLVAHVAFVHEGQPVVVPFTYHFDPSTPDKLYLHGGQNSRAMEVLRSGAPVCIEVTLLDGLVYSRDAMFHTMNYRSCICFGRAQEVTETDRKTALFEKMTRRYFPDRELGRDYHNASKQQMENTVVFELDIEDSSAKMRSGGPKGPHDLQRDPSVTGGVIELETVRHDRPDC